MKTRNNKPIDSNSDSLIEISNNAGKKLLSSSAVYNGYFYENTIPGKVRDTCLDNSDYVVHLKEYLGGGKYGMAFNGDLWRPDNTSIKVAIKLYMDKSDTEENIYNSVSGIFTEQVATYYKGTKCKIINMTGGRMPKIPDFEFLRIIIMEKGTSLDKILDEEKNNFRNFFGIITKTAENCAVFNRGGFLHNDIKPHNCIISDDPNRKKFGGLLIDFGMTTLNRLKDLPPLDALYFLLTTFKFINFPKNDYYINYFKYLCKPYYDAIRSTGITRHQLVTQRINRSTTTHGIYDPNGLCSYDIERELRILCPLKLAATQFVNTAYNAYNPPYRTRVPAVAYRNVNPTIKNPAAVIKLVEQPPYAERVPAAYGRYQPTRNPPTTRVPPAKPVLKYQYKPFR
jgi:hypothetical protein